MKKIIIILIVAVILCVLVVKIIDHEVVDNTETYNSISESITKKTLPEGYTTIKAKETTSLGKLALLTSDNEHTIILVEGAPIKTDKNMLKVLKNKLKLFNEAPEVKASIKPANELLIETNPLPRFDIIIKNKDKEFKGIATFINYKDKTILFICIAKESSFKETIAIDFIKNIQLPKEKELF